MDEFLHEKNTFFSYGSEAELSPSLYFLGNFIYVDFDFKVSINLTK